LLENLVGVAIATHAPPLNAFAVPVMYEFGIIKLYACKFAPDLA